jgi:ankyrin repeat protein
VFAAQARRADIVERLLNAGAHIDGVDDYGLTACFAATFFQSVDVLAVLLAREPDIEIKDGLQWQTPLQHSLAFNDDCISVMLINAGASLRGVRGSLCRFASRSTAAIQAMLNCGVTLNQMRDPLLNYTQLHLIAATHEWSADLHAAADMLLNVCNLDLEARSFGGETCLHIAAAGRCEALRYFINAGADIGSADQAGLTPLHKASDYNCSVLLLAAGADINQQDSETAFQLALSLNWHSALPALLAAGADVRSVGKHYIAPVSADRVESRHCCLRHYPIVC